MDNAQNFRGGRNNNDLIQHIELKPVLTKKDIRDVFFQKQDQQHWQKIANAKAAIETEVHLFIPKKSVRQKKTLLLDEEKKTEIERENRILLEKITKIIQNKRSHQPNDAAINFTTRSKSNERGSQNKGSLNLGKRWDDYKRIQDENQKILNRLMNQKSHFDWEKVDRQNQKHDELVNSMCQFPRILPTVLNDSTSKRSITISPRRKALNKFIRNKQNRTRINLLQDSNKNNTEIFNSQTMILNRSQESANQGIAQNPYKSIQSFANDNSSILNSIENKTQSLASIQNEPKATIGYKNLMIQNDEVDILGSKEMTQDYSEIIHKKYANDELPEQFKAQLNQLRSKSNLGRKLSPMKQLELLIKSKNNNRYENAKSRKILYQNNRYINGRQFEIEMSKTKHKLVIICMNQENKKSQIIQLFLKQAQRIVELATQNMQTKLVGYQKILKFLDYKHGKILLDVPKDLQFYDEQ